MGRKKISITRIQDERNRQITFSKRKSGLLKKAYELSILCDVEIAVIMITGNRKLYQYASSNMNSILIRYTEFKDPDENKTNADILDDITKKERGGADNDSGEEESNPSSFLLTPRTQEKYREIDQEFGQMMQQNQVPPPQRSAPPPPLGSAPPQVMPVTVPVSKSLQQTIHQHLASKEQRSSGASSGQSSAPLSSAFMSPQSDLSSASPLSKPDRPSGSMPPPMNTPTRIQTIRNQTLKLHLPGSGRSYIPLASAGSMSGGHGESENKKSAGLEEQDTTNKPGSKPQLRVYIPGQKEFVPRTQATSPSIPQVSIPAPSTPTTSTQAPTTTTAVDSLTTPVLNLQTPSLFSNLPPMFSSFLGDFPFSQPPTSTTGGGGGTSGDSQSAALVAFPVSIQPSGGTGPGNLILHAQNMGQPFLLTPSVDGRQNPLQGFTPPPAAGRAANMSPNIKDFEQLKAQYERTQQMIHQQLLLSQMQSMLHQPSRAPPAAVTQTSPSNIQRGDIDSGLGGQETEADRYINGSDVMMGGEGSREESSEEPLAKRSRLDNSPNSIVQV